MNFSKTGFGFGRAQQQPAGGQSKPPEIKKVDGEADKARARVVFRTVRRCAGLYKSAKRASDALSEMMLNTNNNHNGNGNNQSSATSGSANIAALAAAPRHAQLRRAILLAWFAFGKCRLHVERCCGAVLALDALLRLVLTEFQRAPFESLFVAPILRDLQSKQPPLLHRRVVTRLHHVCVAAFSQSLRVVAASQQQPFSICDTAGNVLVLLGSLESSRCMTVPAAGGAVTPQMVSALEKIVGIGRTQLCTGIARDILTPALQLVESSEAHLKLKFQPKSQLQQQQQSTGATTNSPGAGGIVRDFTVITELLDALWGRDGGAALLSLTPVSRTLLLKYFLLESTQLLRSLDAAATSADAATSAAATGTLSQTRSLVLWAVLRLPWHSVDRRSRSVFADWDAALQNLVFDACAQCLAASPMLVLATMQSFASSGFVDRLAARLGGGGRSSSSRWLPDVPVANFASMSNCLCNIFFFATSAMLMQSSNANRWGGLLGELCLALHPFKVHTGQLQLQLDYHRAQSSNQPSASATAAASLMALFAYQSPFDALFEAIDSGGSGVSGHWFHAVARLWSKEVLMKVFGVAQEMQQQQQQPGKDGAAGAAVAANQQQQPQQLASSPNTNTSASSSSSSSSSFGDTIRQTLARVFSDDDAKKGPQGRQPWTPQRSREPLPELALPPTHLSWFSYCSFLAAVVSRGRIVSILNQLVQLPFFITTLWRKFSGAEGATGRRWVERAVVLVSEKNKPRPNAAAASAAAAAAVPGVMNSQQLAQVQLQQKQLDLETAVATDFVGCVTLLYATLGHALLVGSDADVRRGWPVPFDVLDGMAGFANSLVLLTVALECNPKTARSAAATAVQYDSGGAARPIQRLQDALVGAKQQLKRFLRLLEDRDVRMGLVPEQRRSAGFWGLDKETLKWANQLIEPSAPATTARDDELVPVHAALSSVWVKVLSTCGKDQAEHVTALTIPQKTFVQNATSFSFAICREMPHVVPFDVRVAALRAAFDMQKSNRRLGQRFYNVQRHHVVEDGFRLFVQSLDGAPTREALIGALRGHIQIQLVDEHGRKEAGIDGGGVFKEFLELLLKELTNPSLGLFKITADGASCYPNPAVDSVFDGASFCGGVAPADMFRFLGRVLGKAVFEGVVVTLPLAGFFLNNVLGRPNVLEDLQTIDAQLFKSLELLKNMEDASLAGLVMADEENVLGNVKTIPLVPGGENIDVTNDNVVRYLHLLAHHRLVKSMQRQTDAFVAGLTDVIDPQHLAQFNGKELKQLIGGKDGGDFDVDELAAAAKYAAGYSASSPQVRWLWEVLREADTLDRQRFLQFCTGSSRPPLLGFASMEPPFAIQRYIESAESIAQRTAGRGFVDKLFGNDEVQHLPMAATCFNLLKLPEYNSKANLKERLLTAIRSKAGFEYA